MPFWNKENKKGKEDEALDNNQNKKPSNPYITFELINSTELSIDMGWPADNNLKTFIKVLLALNTGELVAPQIAQAMIYANAMNQPDKAKVIHKALEPLLNKDADDESSDKPIIQPSQVIPNLMRAYK